VATYNLDQAELRAILSGVVAPQTEAAILAALRLAGDYPGKSEGRHDGGNGFPGMGSSFRGADDRHSLNVRGDEGDDDGKHGHGVGQLLVDVDNSSGAVDVTVPSGVRLFLEEGASATVTLHHDGNIVAAAGDGSVTLDDLGTGGSTLVGGAGSETLIVHSGNNQLIGGVGANTLMGGSGHDTLWGGGHSVLEAGTGANQLFGGLRADSADTLTGGAGRDTLSVFHGDNVLNAGSGDNTIYSGDGHDSIGGGTGHDNVYIGGGGMDTFTGGTGVDNLYIEEKGNDTIYGGANTTVHLDQRFAKATETPLAGGGTQIQFGNGQTINVQHATVVFSDNHVEKIL
jgi:Ca2+-binding RTX toxin-like protein